MARIIQRRVGYAFQPYWHTVGDVEAAMRQMDSDAGGTGRVTHNFYEGFRARPEAVPKQIQLDAEENDPNLKRTEEERLADLAAADVPGFRGGWLVSRRLADLIEAHEPGVHQFLPIEVLRSDGSSCGLTLYVLNVCTRFDTCIAEAFSDVCRQLVFEDPNHRLYDRNLFYFRFPPELTPPKPGTRLALWHDMVAGRAIWADERFHHVIISDALWSAIKETGISGLEREYPFLTIAEVDRDGNTVVLSEGDTLGPEWANRGPRSLAG